MSRRVAGASLILLFAVWAGVVIGVSFLATPAKFLAPSLSMGAALDVGRHTFQLLARAELGMAAAVSVLCWIARANLVALSGSAMLWALVLVQRFWLLPLLDQRVSVYLSGSTPIASHHHMLFIAVEALKVLVLLICAANSIAGRRTPAGQENRTVRQQSV